jgi:hypothetical protein
VEEGLVDVEGAQYCEVVEAKKTVKLLPDAAGIRSCLSVVPQVKLTVYLYWYPSAI